LTKNNDNIDYRWVDKFNTWVEMWALLEINLAGRAYTWGNNHENQVMCRFDRVFCTTHFDVAFSLVNIRALARIGSDHTPSFVTLVKLDHQFKFEKW
jgi:endonuclease/exonuclease/phosphatase family metal-dependent hydrolase